LRAAGLISEAQLKSALEAQVAGGGRLGDFWCAIFGEANFS